MDLVQWLGQQLDEDERIARAAGSVRGPVWWYDGYVADTDGQVLAGEVLDGGSAAVRSLAMATRSDAEGEHAAAHDPARVLREVAADRELLRQYAEVAANDVDDVEYAHGWANALGLAVRLRASVYADRPGYREEWRP